MNQRIRVLRALGEGFERLARAESEHRPGPAEHRPGPAEHRPGYADGEPRPAGAFRRRLPALGIVLAVAVALAVAAGALVLFTHGGRPSPTGGPGGGTPPTAAQIRQEAGYIRVAAQQARRSSGCTAAPRRQPAFLGGAPSSALISELAVLRAPASAADRPPRGLLNGLAGVYRDYVRRALVLDGVSYWVVAQHSEPRAGFTPTCARRETALLHKELPRIPAALRAPTLALNARLIRLDTGSRVPTDVICLEFHGPTSGGGTCGVTAAQIRAGRTLTQEAGHVLGIVPDGVASVTIESGRSPSSQTITVSGNLFVAPGRDIGYPKTILWRSAQGQVIRRVTEHPPGGSYCRANPGACTPSSGFSSGSESSAAPQK